jgi:small subunit ribosomal protein S1
MHEEEKPAQESAPAAPDKFDKLRRGARPAGNAGRVPALDDRDLSFGAKTVGPGLDEDIDRDLEEAMGGLSASELKALYGGAPQPRKAAGPEGPPKRMGKVLSVRGKDVFVDVGGRTQGVLPTTQFPEGLPRPGDEVEVSIEGYDLDGLLLLSRGGQAVEADWSTVAIGQIVEARVTAATKGGLSVEVNGIRGFMPISQIEGFRVEDINPYVGQKLKCLVAEVDREERNLVVSRRGLLEQERASAKVKLWGELAESQVREGVVRSVKPFGAFVDLGGVDGLLPVGEMSWQKVANPEDIVKPGQKVRVVVLRIDREQQKLTLGLRQLSDSPWDSAMMNYPPGSIVNGKVTRLAEYGAFVEVEPGVEGLVHISEVSHARIRRPQEVLKEGQEVSVKVLHLDPQARRMSLSVKAAAARPAPEPPPTAPQAAEAEEPEAPVKPRKPRTTPLKGGTGGSGLLIPLPPSE